MDSVIIAAIITAVGAVVAAVIGLIRRDRGSKATDFTRRSEPGGKPTPEPGRDFRAIEGGHIDSFVAISTGSPNTRITRRQRE